MTIDTLHIPGSPTTERIALAILAVVILVMLFTPSLRGENNQANSTAPVSSAQKQRILQALTASGTPISEGAKMRVLESLH